MQDSTIDFSSAGRANSITDQKLRVSMCVSVCVNFPQITPTDISLKLFPVLLHPEHIFPWTISGNPLP